MWSSASGPEGDGFEAGGFGLAGDQVGVLDGLAGCAFAEVVDGTQGDDEVTGGVGGVGDVDEVGAGGPLGVRGLVGDANEGAVGVELSREVETLLGGGVAAR